MNKMIKRTALFTVLALCAASTSASEGYQLQAGGWSVVPTDCDGMNSAREVYTPHIAIKSDSHAVNWTVHYDVAPPPAKTCTLKGSRQWEFTDAQDLCHIYTPDINGRHYQTPKWHATINKRGKAVMTCHFERGEGACTVACHAPAQ